MAGKLLRVLKLFGFLLLAGIAVLSVAVQSESIYTLRNLGGEGQGRALVLFHPSRDAHFTDDLSMAFSDGLKDAGLAVDLATLTASTPGDPSPGDPTPGDPTPGDLKRYALIGVVSNTYYWTPDLPTLRYLGRAKLDSSLVVGLMCGAGSTTRSESILKEALRKTGARRVETRSFWLWRPNDRNRMSEPNRDVALRRARQLGAEMGRTVLASHKPGAN